MAVGHRASNGGDLLEGGGATRQGSWKVMEGHGRSWKVMEGHGEEGGVRSAAAMLPIRRCAARSFAMQTPSGDAPQDRWEFRR